MFARFGMLVVVVLGVVPSLSSATIQADACFSSLCVSQDFLTPVKIMPTYLSPAALSVMNGNVGIGTENPSAVLDVVGLGPVSAIIVPRDTTANRPLGVNGMIRYNTTLGMLEGFAGSAWARLGPGTVTSVSAGNGLTGGPITSSGTLSIATGGVGENELSANAVSNSKIQDGSISTPKIFANPGVNRLVATDATTGGGLVPFECSSGQTLKFESNGWVCVAQNLGTVTSVDLSVPGIFSVTGAPVTSSGTISIGLQTQGANQIFAAPVGSAGAPSFRTLVESDIPSLDASKIVTGTISTGRLGSGTADSSTFLRGDGTWASAGGGSGANTSLSNLASTAINTNLLPQVPTGPSIGSPSHSWASVNAGVFNAIASNQSAFQIVAGNGTAPDGTLISSRVEATYNPSASSRSLVVHTANASAATSTPTGDVIIASGNRFGGSGGSGSIKIYVGTSEFGSRGKFKIADGSEGGVGDVWTSVGTDGAGHWSSPRSPAGTMCGWNDGTLVVDCQGEDPSTTCPAGYTQRFSTTAAFCTAN